MTPEQPETPAENPASAEPGEPSPRRSMIGGFFDFARRAGGDFLSMAIGKIVTPPTADEDAARQGEAIVPLDQDPQRRLDMLHDVAQRLRGVADDFIAAKMDELEARVDAKLDQIEHRIDDKIVALSRQLQELRDQELRHRLRILNLTLIFSVLVAMLSLLYKWLSKQWAT
ncbi:MAG: hypothetical protein JNG88_10735 [Phycisphaerales bacterium]|nr:hypothetical protein [Phycisphaerales bacterium]